MIAAVFPGQGSQKPGMGKSLADKFSAANSVFDIVGSAAGTDMRALCWETDEETLRETQNAQLALYTCSMAAWAVLTEGGLLPNVVAGHSVGEYAALVAAGVYAIDDGARLVQIRGSLMAEAGKTSPGAMAAVLGLEREALEQACEAAEGTVVIANDNCPGQLVISGEAEAVRRASQVASELGAKRVLPLNVSGAFHSPLMEVPARHMREALDGITHHHLHRKVFMNVTSEPLLDSYDAASLLERQLMSPVRWTESVQHMIRDGVTRFVELGSGEVLCGLVKRIDRGIPSSAIDSADAAESWLAVASGN
jgi:[acyl-carrier-protein] S-malonyltransferase